MKRALISVLLLSAVLSLSSCVSKNTAKAEFFEKELLLGTAGDSVSVCGVIYNYDSSLSFKTVSSDERIASAEITYISEELIEISVTAHGDGHCIIRLEDSKDNSQAGQFEITVADTPEAEYRYAANINTKKIHLSSCRYVSDSSQREIRYTNSEDTLNFLIRKGYQKCKVCMD